MRAGEREGGSVVIESRIRPCTRTVTLRASLWEVRTHVVRICGVLEVFEVARHTRDARQVVVVVDVAIRTCARGNGMRSRQGEIGKVMVEGGVQPIRCVVALRTIGWKVARNVVRVRGALKIFQVAAHAGGGCQIVIVVDVTVCALTRRHSMSTRQQKSGGGVIKFRVQPIVSAVATFARG